MLNWVNYFNNTNRTLFNESIRNRRLLEIIMQETPVKGKILEAGCGTALLSLLLADSGFDVTAMDLTDEVIEYAKKRFCLNGIKLNYKRGDILKLGSFFEEKEFDTICHSGVLEHFSDDEIIRSLKEHKKISKKVVFNIPNNRNKLTQKSFGNERLMNNRVWVRLIQQAGYASVKVYGGYDLIRPSYFLLPGAFFNRRISCWWKWFSRHSIFVCQ